MDTGLWKSLQDYRGFFWEISTAGCNFLMSVVSELVAKETPAICVVMETAKDIVL